MVDVNVWEKSLTSPHDSHFVADALQLGSIQPRQLHYLDGDAQSVAPPYPLADLACASLSHHTANAVQFTQLLSSAERGHDIGSEKIREGDMHAHGGMARASRAAAGLLAAVARTSFCFPSSFSVCCYVAHIYMRVHTLQIRAHTQGDQRGKTAEKHAEKRLQTLRTPSRVPVEWDSTKRQLE